MTAFNPISLGGAELLPVVLVDTREQTPLVFTRLQSVVGTLVTGDYSIQGFEDQFTVERKSIADLTNCCAGDNRIRFEKELSRMRAYRFRRLLVVGSQRDILNHDYRSQVSPNAVMASLDCWTIRYDCPVCWAHSPEAASELVERWVFWFFREQCRPVQQLITTAAQGRVLSEIAEAAEIEKT